GLEAVAVPYGVHPRGDVAQLVGDRLTRPYLHLGRELGEPDRFQMIEVLMRDEHRVHAVESGLRAQRAGVDDEHPPVLLQPHARVVEFGQLHEFYANRVSDYPWSRAAATGVGSHPGEDHLEALRVVFGELPGLPYLPELPARGVGADMVGRGASLLIDMPVEVRPSGWRLTGRPGRDARRAREHLGRDLDGLEEIAQGYEGPLKVQVCGPWTLAASIELHHGDKVLADAG